jgi:cytosine/adenosine deaminase-related metal-dependent hydrolase
MTTLLIHRARCIATMDDANTELKDASLLIRDGRIERIIAAEDNTDELLTQVDEVIDAHRHVVVPGLINPTVCGWTTALKPRTPSACASRPHAAV